MHKGWMALVVLVAVAAMPAPVAAADKAGEAAAVKLAPGDVNFAKNAWMDSVGEVKLGELALKQTQNEEVKKLAQMMVDDHGAARDELDTLLKDKGIDHADTLDKGHQGRADKLGKLTGPAFDKAYVTMMVKDHVQSVARFKKHAKAGKDEQLKAYAQKYVDKLQHHLDHSKTVHKALGK